ncbi:MAG: endonuclease domain-containing protein [Caulobacteraceae bacterium]
MRNAKQLRRRLTPPEARLWARIKRRSEGFPNFRRQFPIGPYVLDFYCSAAKLAIEIDGWAHAMGDQPQRDERRDAWLKSRGITTLRIPAADVQNAFEDCVEMIVRTTAGLCAPAAPSTAVPAVPLPRFTGEER